MIISIFKLGVGKTDKRARRELWSGQESNEEQIPNDSHKLKENGLSWMPQRNHLGLKYLFLNAIIWWRWNHRAWRGTWGGPQETQMAGAKLNGRPSPTQPLLWKATIASPKSDQTCQRGEQEGRRQLEEPRLMSKPEMRKCNNWKPLWWHQEQSQRRQPCYHICSVIIIKC